ERSRCGRESQNRIAQPACVGSGGLRPVNLHEVLFHKMHSRQSLELRQQQQLALTPQLQQSIRFLQLSAHDLELEVARALEENPLLERDDEYDIDAEAAVAPASDDGADDRWILS